MFSLRQVLFLTPALRPFFVGIGLGFEIDCLGSCGLEKFLVLTASF